MVGQSLEVPTLGGHGKIYLEVAGQQREEAGPGRHINPTGNAVYAALSADAGPITSTFEMKSNRNFFPVSAGVNLTRAPEFSVVAYSFLPPAETPTLVDTEGVGNFNACVNGGRLRTDARVSANLLAYGQAIFAYTQSEQTNGGCDAQGHTVASSVPAEQVQDNVWDGLAGVEWYSDTKLSHAFLSVGVRDDTKVNGDLSYRERHLEYSIVKYLGNAYSIEAQGFHRIRKEETQNLDANHVEQWWNEGENYIALKIAPAWVLSQGFEYTNRVGQPTYYFNGSVLYKFTSSSNVRVFVGQQRGAFRCAAGVCRLFPPFEGARGELTWRF
jgi:hypothetical protein